MVSKIFLPSFECCLCSRHSILLIHFRSAPWPIRLYVIDNGTMQFISAPTDCAHDVSELRAWLEKRHESK